MIQKTKISIIIETDMEVETKKEMPTARSVGINVCLVDNELIGKGWYEDKQITKTGAQITLNAITNALVSYVHSRAEEGLIDYEVEMQKIGRSMNMAIMNYQKEQQTKIITEKDMIQKPSGLSFITGQT